MVIQLTTAMLMTKIPASAIIVRQGILVSKTTAMRPNSHQNDMRKTSEEVSTFIVGGLFRSFHLLKK